MTRYFLGVDAGGTKTHAAVMDDSGNILGVAVDGCGNWERVGLTAAVTILENVVSNALNSAKLKFTDLSFSTFALAGVDWESDRKTLEKELLSRGFHDNLHIMNDAFAVLAAGTEDGIGCASIAGTGGKTVACDGQAERATLGMSLGEGGGAGQLADECLRVMAEIRHFQRARTSLSDAVLNATGFSSEEDFFEGIARDNVGLDETIAPLIFLHAAENDPAATEIVKVVAAQHARDVLGVVEDLSFPSQIPLVRAGGLHTAASKTFDSEFERVIRGSDRDFTTTVLLAPPVAGAMIHATKKAGLVFSPKSRENLFSTISRLLKD